MEREKPLGPHATIGWERAERVSRHRSHRREAGQESRSDMVEVRGLPDMLHKTFAPIEEVLYDEVMVHGVPPDEQGISREVSAGYIIDHQPTIQRHTGWQCRAWRNRP
jgi:hypothetical protein